MDEVRFASELMDIRHRIIAELNDLHSVTVVDGIINDAIKSLLKK